MSDSSILTWFFRKSVNDESIDVKKTGSKKSTDPLYLKHIAAFENR